MSGKAYGLLRGKPCLVLVSLVGLCGAVLIAGGCTDLQSDGPTSSADEATSTTILVTMEGGTGQTPAGQTPTAQESASPAPPASESNGTPGNTSTTEFLPMMEGQAFAGSPATEWNRYENSDPLLDYSGTGWWTVSGGGASGGNHYRANSAGAAVEMEFMGSRIALIAFTGPAMGRAKLTLDGGTPIYLEFYDPVGGQEKVWTSGSLGSHLHTLKIEWSGAKNPSSTGTVISIDAVDVMGTLVN